MPADVKYACPFHKDLVEPCPTCASLSLSAYALQHRSHDKGKACEECLSKIWTPEMMYVQKLEFHPDCTRHPKEGVYLVDSQGDAERRYRALSALSQEPAYCDLHRFIDVPEHFSPQQIIPALQIPPRTIDELIAAMESMFEVAEPTDCSTAVTGEPYIKLTSSGVIEEGERLSVYCTDQEKAIELFYAEFCDFVFETASESTHTGPARKLYWRLKPMMREVRVEIKDEFFNDPPRGCEIVLYNVIARLLISDKPQITTGRKQRNEEYWGPGLAELIKETEK